MRRIVGTEKIKRKEHGAVLLGVGDKDRAANNKGSADDQGRLPSGSNPIGPNGVRDGAYNSAREDACGIVVLLNDRVSARLHPQLRDVVAHGLDGKGVYCTSKSAFERYGNAARESLRMNMKGSR